MGKPPNRTNRQPRLATTPPAGGSSSPRWSHLGFLAILLLFVTLAGLYSVMVPLTQGEDELAHYRYLSFIAETGRLPINAEERQQAWYRADWPPLYHLLVGWAVSPLDTTQPHLKDVGESPRRRLVGEIFYPRLIIYTADVTWPWQDGILAWHLGRFISIAFAAGALVVVYLTVLEISRGAGEQRSRGDFFSPLHPRPSAPLHIGPLLVTALLAFTPRFLFTSAMLGDDSLFILLSAIFIWLLLRALRGDDRWWLYGLMGVVLGLSITTKYSTGLLPLAVIPVVWWRARQQGWGWPAAVGRVAISWLGVLLGASWWFGWIGYFFNTIARDGLFFGLFSPLLNTGPDVSMRRVFAFFSGGEFSGPARPDAIAAGSFGQWGVYLFQTFWGVPVLEHDPLFPWAYLLLALLCLLALVGLWQVWRVSDSPTRMLLATLLLIVALLLPFPILRFFLTRNILETGQGRHILYPAAQAIPLLLVWGWSWAGTQGSRGAGVQESKGATDRPYVSRFTFHVSRFTFLIPLLLLTWSICQFIYMKETYPTPLPIQTTTFDPASIPQPVIPQKFGDSIEFLGYDFQPDATQAIINLTLYWQALAPVEENYRVRVQLRDEADQPRFTWLSHPLNGKYPTRAWDKGDVIRDELALPLAAVPAGSYTLYLNLLHEAEDVPLLDEPYWLIQIPLGQRQPIPNPATLADVTYRLWVDDQPARHRQTLPLSWLAQNGSSTQNPKWTLLGPDNLPRPPAASADNTAVFLIGADWPSGEYRLQVETDSGSSQTEPLLTVVNDARMFELPPLPDTYVPVEANFAGQVQLRGYSLPTRRVEPGGELPLTLYWQGLAPVMADLVTFAVLLDANQQPHGQVDRYPLGFYSPLLWDEGEVVVDAFSLPLPGAAPPGVYTLHLGQYRLVDEQPVSQPLLQDGQPSQTTAVVIGPIKVGGPPADVTVTDPQPEYRLNQAFGEQVTLLGYDLTDQTGQPLPSSGEGEAAPLASGQSLHLTLYWRAEANLALNLTTFGHLRDAANETVAQNDSPPAGGRYPTSLWAAGEIIVDELTLPLTALPPGRYTPVVGLYDPASGTRLLTPGEPANEVALKSISVGQE